MCCSMVDCDAGGQARWVCSGRAKPWAPAQRASADKAQAEQTWTCSSGLDRLERNGNWKGLPRLRSDSSTRLRNHTSGVHLAQDAHRLPKAGKQQQSTSGVAVDSTVACRVYVGMLRCLGVGCRPWGCMCAVQILLDCCLLPL